MHSKIIMYANVVWVALVPCVCVCVCVIEFNILSMTMIFLLRTPVSLESFILDAFLWSSPPPLAHIIITFRKTHSFGGWWQRRDSAAFSCKWLWMELGRGQLGGWKSRWTFTKNKIIASGPYPLTNEWYGKSWTKYTHTHKWQNWAKIDNSCRYSFHFFDNLSEKLHTWIFKSKIVALHAKRWKLHALRRCNAGNCVIHP